MPCKAVSRALTNSFSFEIAIVEAGIESPPITGVCRPAYRWHR
jgi:hypothetical protein